jgi:carboxypeptidase Q
MNLRFAFLALLLSSLILVSACFAGSNSGVADPASPASDGTLPALTSIAGNGMMNTHSFDYLEELSDQVGGRVTGSPEAKRAIEWGIAKMKAIGLENVRAEKWQISRGWKRISAEAAIVEPVQRRLTVDSMGWVGSTPPGGVEAEVVPVNTLQLEQEMKENSSKWAGKVLLIVRKGEPPANADGNRSFATFGKFLDAAYAAHAVAVIGGQGGSEPAGMHLTHTGVMGYDAYYDIPVVSMVVEDLRQLQRFLDHGTHVRLKINVQNETTSSPADSANVVGEIRGKESPEQVIVVGGHLDSWDLAQGSTDDGTGVATTLGAAEAIIASGHKPRRTIRFVLFTGEEQGLLGSRAYVKTHKDEIANHVAAVILDTGQGPVVRLNMGGHKDLIPAMEKFAGSVKSFGQLEINDRSVFGTDAGPFILAGLPGINMGQDSPEYKYTHHSAVDTLDKVDPDVLTRDATMMALTSFWIADRPDRLASPWPAEKTARTLKQQKQDGMLKASGLWPFGDIADKDEKKDEKKAAGESQ